MELSVKEKAQRYDEALEVINKCETDKYGCIIGVKPTDIFPELQESEDEEIRRALIKGTKVPGVEFFRAVTKANEEFITRLMQGEQELTDRYRAVIKSNEEFIARLMQGKQKPTDKCEGCNNAKGCVACVDGSEWAHIEEHKPAWSEEDKRKINRIHSILGQAADTHAYSTTCRLIGDKECIELQDFIRSLKERVQPQSQRKPSDEQIMALRWVLNNIPYNKHKEEISGLLEQIMKLREE